MRYGDNVRGAIVRTMRVADVDGGAELRLSAPGIVVRVHANAAARRTFRRACAALGVVATGCEGLAGLDGTYNRRTGELEGAEDAVVSAWQCVGEVDALRRLAECPAVAEWHFALAVRAPRGAAGSGPEKLRSPRPVDRDRAAAGSPYSAEVWETHLAASGTHPELFE